MYIKTEVKRNRFNNLFINAADSALSYDQC